MEQHWSGWRKVSSGRNSTEQANYKIGNCRQQYSGRHHESYRCVMDFLPHSKKTHISRKIVDSNVALNAERAGFQHEYSTRTKMLSSELQQLKQVTLLSFGIVINNRPKFAKEKSAEMSNILHQMDKQEEALRQTNR